jgi:broad specificity phosphatase PhoE
MRLLVCRHGHTPKNVDESGQELVRGWDEVGLSSAGRLEAAELAKKIAQRYKVLMIYTSDLNRARETAEFIADRSRAEISPSAGLRTWNLGELTGKRVQAVLTELRHFDIHPNDCPRGGETKNFFLGRLGREFDELLPEVRHSKGDVVLVTHGRCFAAIPGLLSGTGQVTPYSGVPKTGALAQLKPDGKQWKMVVFHRDLRTLAMSEGFPSSRILCYEF